MTRIMSYEHGSGKEGCGKGTSYEVCCREYCAMEGIQGCSVERRRTASSLAFVLLQLSISYSAVKSFLVAEDLPAKQFV